MNSSLMQVFFTPVLKYISPLHRNFFLKDKGIVDSYISQAAIPLINFMVKAPVKFKTINFNNKGTPLNLMLQFITKIFKDNKELEDELHSMCAVDMIMAMLELRGTFDVCTTQVSSQVIKTKDNYFKTRVTTAKKAFDQREIQIL